MFWILDMEQIVIEGRVMKKKKKILIQYEIL